MSTTTKRYRESVAYWLNFIPSTPPPSPSIPPPLHHPPPSLHHPPPPSTPLPPPSTTLHHPPSLHHPPVPLHPSTTPLPPSTPPPLHHPPAPLHTQSFHVKLPFLMMDASMLLPPTDTPLTGIEFTRRLPCGETERARKVRKKYLGAVVSVPRNRGVCTSEPWCLYNHSGNVLHTHTHTQAMRVFFAIRILSQQISRTEEKELPLTMPSNSASVADIVDLSELLKEWKTTASVLMHTYTCALARTHTHTHTHTYTHITRTHTQTTVTLWLVQLSPLKSKHGTCQGLFGVLLSCKLRVDPYWISLLPPTGVLTILWSLQTPSFSW